MSATGLIQEYLTWDLSDVNAGKIEMTFIPDGSITDYRAVREGAFLLSQMDESEGIGNEVEVTVYLPVECLGEFICILERLKEKAEAGVISS